MIRQLQWSKPTVVDEYRFLPARIAEGSLAVAKGTWSNCDVWVVAPDSWGAVNAARVRLYGLQDLGRQRLAVSDLWLAGFTQSAGGWRTWLAASVRGRVCDGFEVTGASPGGASLPPAWVYLRCWGRESTPETMAQSIQSPMQLQGGELAMPRRAAHVVYYDRTNDRHRLWEGDAFGRPKVVVVPEALADSGQGKSTAREATRVAVNFGCQLRWAQMSNTAAAPRWFQIFDQAAALGGGETPVMQKTAPVDDVATYEFPGEGWKLFNGLVFGCSTTPDVYTAAADGWFAWVSKQ